ncbi:RND family efflux transporter, MFP subunit [Limimonas halophila]|uniref:RND family efflux transporter, MFP subunit n=1 Tax=Limimonas halophila TaxID=1082479 RepID=A0A1G7T6T5_9PROT|nr:RND family efflux transporter, MFP subunit [Limimonas halophila]
MPAGRNAPVLGSFVATQEGVVAARVAAPVEAYLVEVGDRVERGDTLVMLDDERISAERQQARAALAEARAALNTSEEEVALARQQLQRQQNLEGSSAYSKARVEDLRQELAISRAEVASAEAAVQSARADLDLAKIDLKHTEVRAPYAGVVTERMAEAGAYVNGGDPLVGLVSDQSLEIEVAVPASRLGALRQGDVVDVELSGGGTAEARVRAILPRENRMTRTRTVRLVPRFDTSARRVAAGESVTVSVPLDTSRQVLSVHKDAILRRGGQTTIYVYADGKAEVHPVKLGDEVGSRFEVLDGVAAGALAVVRGNERLRPGQPLSIDKRVGPTGDDGGQDGGGDDGDDRVQTGKQPGGDQAS